MSLAVVNRMCAHPHRQQEQLSSGQHTVLTGVPVRFFIVLAGIMLLLLVRAVANGPVGPAMAGPIIEPAIRKKH